ncbi:DUF1800 domain-containing protein [Sphingomonas sp. J315]|nr:DUF1800 domain-containing protein [Sphingomonas sp. J315]
MDKLDSPPIAADEAPALPPTAAGEAARATGRAGGSIAAVSVSSLALALAACDSGGGGGGGVVSTPGPTPTPSPAPPPITAAQASRFLAQATMGATAADIADVQARGFDGWITAEFAKTRPTSLWDWLVARSYNVSANINNEAGFDNAMWSQLVGAGDQLRQRVGMALLEILVVGIGGVNLNWRQFAMAAYVDVLMDNAFGNFRTLIERVTYNAAMGSFLTFLGNRKADARTGSVPDENYARELMQLFTIGLHRLNMDGSLVTSGGQPVETYTPDDVSGLARVFTGLVVDGSDSTTPDRYRRAMIFNAGQHETGASTFLGTTVAAGLSGSDAVRQALDTIFAHPNVPPFVSRQLIQRLVTSNPSPAYIGRVSAVFANNGSGVRGDMQAVIRAILLDSEARTEPSAASAGKAARTGHAPDGLGARLWGDIEFGQLDDGQYKRCDRAAGPVDGAQRIGLQLLSPGLYPAQHADRHRRTGRAGIADHQRNQRRRLRQLHAGGGEQHDRPAHRLRVDQRYCGGQRRAGRPDQPVARGGAAFQRHGDRDPDCGGQLDQPQ